MDRWKCLVNVDEERVAKWTRLYMFWDSIISRLPHYRRLNGLALMSIGCWERLYSRSVPPLDEPIRRGEGVALVLLNDAITSWQAAGKQWKSWSARMISASFRIGEKPRDILHVVSCYAPTWGSSRAVKDEFWDGLESLLAAVPPGDQWIILGDFNARIGSRICPGDQWDGVRGPYGFGELNDAGRELLSFLSSYQGMVGNSWFQKKDIYKQTWRHPKSGDWHCIDYVLMQQKHRSSCLDVSVKRGSVCDTDHNLVCLKLRTRKPYKRKQRCVLKGRRIDVTKLRTSVPGDSDGGEPLKLTFVTQVLEKAHAVWPVERDIDGQWSALQGHCLSLPKMS